MSKKTAISETQERLPFGNRRPGGAFALERRLIVTAGILLALIAVVYAYLIVASVSHTALREGLARENASLAGDVAALEGRYLVRSASITESYARSLGFVSPASQIFLTRAGSLSFRDAR